MYENIQEPARAIPIVRETDVLVCGGGPAGIAAAFTARRAGAKVLILERHPFLGGVWTAGALTIIIDSEGKSGLNRELVARLQERSAVSFWSDFPLWPVYGVEAMKCLLDDMVGELGVDVQLYTSVAAVERDGNRVTGVYTESKSGREFVAAKVVIDTTGDGDVAALAGCPFEHGRPGDGKTQPMTLYGRIGGYRGAPVHIEPIVSIARAAGFEPSYGRVTLFEQPGQPGVFMLMATHKYGSGIDARNLTKVEIEARREIRQLVEILKRDGGPDWADVYLIDTGPFIGVREGRRILGRAYLTHDDIATGRKFDDGICRVGFGVDIHHPDPKEGSGLMNMKTLPYDIPYRCLLARDIDNLMMAGRCISGDHIAMASYRVTGDALAMGEAAGLAAAMACDAGVAPPDVDVSELLARLAKMRD
ncbi:MAG TPA: FAD-dependent oxidoreductase [Capsulimonadaceae bacterium]|jgi:glycine/D-amino acid oxidase-like deaminating enzyme